MLETVPASQNSLPLERVGKEPSPGFGAGDSLRPVAFAVGFEVVKPSPGLDVGDFRLQEESEAGTYESHLQGLMLETNRVSRRSRGRGCCKAIEFQSHLRGLVLETRRCRFHRVLQSHL